MLRVQSGPIKNSLVAFSTLTVGEEEEEMDAIDEIIKKENPLNFGEALVLVDGCAKNNQKRKGRNLCGLV